MLLETLGALFFSFVPTLWLQDEGTTSKEPDLSRSIAMPPEMKALERMIHGEWRMSLGGRPSQFDTWTLGPGGYSITNDTYGKTAEGGPWRTLDVYFWHPGREEICMLGFLPDIPTLGRGLSEGTMKIEGESGMGRFDLYQPGSLQIPRKMGLRWNFDGRDEYLETLLEGVGAANRLGFLAEWTYSRSTELTPIPDAEPQARVPNEPFKGLGSLLIHSWKGSTEGALDLRVSFEWLPYLDVVQLHIETHEQDGQESRRILGYLYEHPTNKTLKCLALSNFGDVHVGEPKWRDGILEVDLQTFALDKPVTQYNVQLELTQEGRPKTRVWLVRGGERTLVLDQDYRPTQ